MNSIPSLYIGLVIVLWMLPVSAWLVPRLASTVVYYVRWTSRADIGLVVVLSTLLLAAVLYGGSKAETNEPPAVIENPSARINLYHVENGVLVPIDAKVIEVLP